jgi:hypothetical protein
VIAQRIVDILLETGEPDQDYDHEPWDEIVRQLEAAGIHGAYHREFDKYQGVYLNVPHVGKFWHLGGFDDVLFNEDTEEPVQIENLPSYCRKVIDRKVAMQNAQAFTSRYLSKRKPKL